MYSPVRDTRGSVKVSLENQRKEKELQQSKLEKMPPKSALWAGTRVRVQDTPLPGVIFLFQDTQQLQFSDCLGETCDCMAKFKPKESEQVTSRWAHKLSTLGLFPTRSLDVLTQHDFGSQKLKMVEP